MPSNTYDVDVAIKTDGECLALIEGRILPFSSPDALEEFIEQLRLKKDQCVSKMVPLDDQISGEAVAAAIEFLEHEVRGLSVSEEIVVRASHSRCTKRSAVYQEVDAGGQPIPADEARLGTIYIKTRYLDQEVPDSIVVRVSLPPKQALVD